MRTDDAAFWARVDQSGGANACWPWRGAINASGYGSVSIRSKIRTASRIAYELANGPIPKGLGYHGNVVRHSCDNRPCCNPQHLILGTQADNNRDRDERGRIKSRRKGEANHKAVLTSDQVQTIRLRVGGGAAYELVAREFDCSKSAISHIANGRNWAWLPEAAT